KNLQDGELLKLAQAKDAEAMEQVVRRHQGLVVSLARKYAFNAEMQKDLESEGNIGLLRAIEKYQGSRKVKFATYAYFWIRRYILRAIMKEFELFRIPERIQQLKIKKDRVRERYQMTWGREPTINELAEELRIPPDILKKWLTHGEEIKVFASELESDDGEKRDVFEVVNFAGENFVLVPAELLRKRDLLQRIFERLQQKEKRANVGIWLEVLKLHFGIGCVRDYSYKEIAARLKISRQRVHQIVSTCLEKLQQEWEEMKNERDSEIHQGSA
ncbi:MAG TPA: sigma-70 family RNA polymerase sigma factor, partial [bacterium]|nr:sigma-70 family RNA polymerase sigma factor [bacterium]